MAFTDREDATTRVACASRQGVGAQGLRRTALSRSHGVSDDRKDDVCAKYFSSPSCGSKVPSTTFCNEKSSSSLVAPEKNLPRASLA